MIILCVYSHTGVCIQRVFKTDLVEDFETLSIFGWF